MLDSVEVGAGGCSVIEDVAEAPFSVAVTTAVPAVVIEPAVTLKEAVEEEAATETEAGVVRLALLSERVTVRADGAAPLSVTVQDALALEASVVGLQTTEVSVGIGGA